MVYQNDASIMSIKKEKNKNDASMIVRSAKLYLLSFSLEISIIL